MKNNIIIFGNGKHAKIIFDELEKLKKYNFLGYVNKKNIITYKKKKYDLINFYKKYLKKKVRGIIAIGNNNLRNKISEDVEKIIPKFILRCIEGRSLQIHGNGSNLRHYLSAIDFASALELLSIKGEEGQAYNIASDLELSNLEVADLIKDQFHNKKIECQS